METINLDDREKARLLAFEEGHFLDLKARGIAPAKLTKSLSAFANADGGSLHVGVWHDKATGQSHWDGFPDVEAANGHIQALEQFFPLGVHASYQFLRAPDDRSLVLHVEIDKTPDIRRASDGVAYLRRGAQNLPQKTHEQLNRLELNKGIRSFETHLASAPLPVVENSIAVLEFITEVCSTYGA